MVEDAIVELKSAKLKKGFNFNVQIQKMTEIISSLEKFHDFLDKFEIDDPFTRKILDTNDVLNKRLKSLKNLLLEYQEVEKARDEIKSGKTFTVDELLNEL